MSDVPQRVSVGKSVNYKEVDVSVLRGSTALPSTSAAVVTQLVALHSESDSSPCGPRGAGFARFLARCAARTLAAPQAPLKVALRRVMRCIEFGNGCIERQQRRARLVSDAWTRHGRERRGKRKRESQARSRSVLRTYLRADWTPENSASTSSDESPRRGSMASKARRRAAPCGSSGTLRRVLHTISIKSDDRGISCSDRCERRCIHT